MNETAPNDAADRPALRAADGPHPPAVLSTWRAPAARTTASVSSVEPSSATITSLGGSVCSPTLRSVCSSRRARSFVGITTETP